MHLRRRTKRNLAFRGSEIDRHEGDKMEEDLVESDTHPTSDSSPAVAADVGPPAQEVIHALDTSLHDRRGGGVGGGGGGGGGGGDGTGPVSAVDHDSHVRVHYATSVGDLEPHTTALSVSNLCIITC